jgi:hypothetical protein
MTSWILLIWFISEFCRVQLSHSNVRLITAILLNPVGKRNLQVNKHRMCSLARTLSELVMCRVWEDYKAYPRVVDFVPKLFDSHLPSLPISLLENHSGWCQCIVACAAGRSSVVCHSIEWKRIPERHIHQVCM